MTPVLVQAPFIVFTGALHRNQRLPDQEFQPVVYQKKKRKILEVCKGNNCALRTMKVTFTKKGEKSLHLPKTNTSYDAFLFGFYLELCGHMVSTDQKH